METKKFYAINVCKGFIYNNSKLVEVEVYKQTITQGENGWISRLTVKNGDFEKEISEEELYQTEEDFRRGRCVEKQCLLFDLLGTDEYGRFYTIVDGKVVENFLDPKKIDVFYLGDFSKKFIVPELLQYEKIYKEREIASQMLCYTVKNLNGSEEIREGVLHKILLTDEQKKAVDEFKKAFVKCQEVGINFGYNHYEERLYAWNSSRNETVTQYCKDLESDGYEIADIENPDVRDEFFVNMKFNYLSEDYNLGVKK